MAVLVVVDTRDGKVAKAAMEAINYGQKMDGPVTVATFGNADNSVLSGLGAYGANKVVVARAIEHVDAVQLCRFITSVAEAEGADSVIFSHDPTGKTIAPLVAAKMGAGHVPGAISLPEGNQIRKNVFSGKAIATYTINSAKKVISVMPNSFPVEEPGGTADVQDFGGDVGSPSITVKEVRKAGGALSLPEAELVVSAGRGMKGPENWGPVEELAEILGAATACSRPVADMDWRPHHEHVGQTGVAIRPNLYIAIGISGAIQHLAGVNGSKVIVVINKDPEAPFFKAADYGIIGDAFEVLPKLIEAAKAFKAAQ